MDAIQRLIAVLVPQEKVASFYNLPGAARRVASVGRRVANAGRRVARSSVRPPPLPALSKPAVSAATSQLRPISLGNKALIGVGTGLGATATGLAARDAYQAGTGQWTGTEGPGWHAASMNPFNVGTSSAVWNTITHPLKSVYSPVHQMLGGYAGPDFKTTEGPQIAIGSYIDPETGLRHNRYDQQQTMQFRPDLERDIRNALQNATSYAAYLPNYAPQLTGAARSEFLRRLGANATTYEPYYSVAPEVAPVTNDADAATYGSVRYPYAVGGNHF